MDISKMGSAKALSELVEALGISINKPEKAPIAHTGGSTLSGKERALRRRKRKSEKLARRRNRR